MGLFNLNLRSQTWAIIYCGVSSFGALCYGYDQIYYTGILGMKPFIHDYGTVTDAHGNPPSPHPLCPSPHPSSMSANSSAP